MNNDIDTYEFLSKSCEDFFNKMKFFEKGDLLKSSLKNFCANHNIETANNVYKAFLDTYRVSGLEKLISTMRDFEEKASTLLSKQRDHYVHTVNVFLYGIAIYISNKNFRQNANRMLKYPDAYEQIEEEFLYRWGIASLFHDVGYPIEVAYKTISEFSSVLMLPSLIYSNEEVFSSGKIEKIQKPAITLDLHDMDEMLYINCLQPKDQFKNDYYNKYPDMQMLMSNNILELISKKIAQALKFADENAIYKYLYKKIKQSLELGIVDHAIFSTISLLKWSNEVYLKSRWNPAYFYMPIVDSATAIFLHNSYEYIFMKVPFNLEKLRVNAHPLTFLLILCDRIQECDRTSYGYIPEKISFVSSTTCIDDDKFNLNLVVESNIDQKDISSANSKINKSINETIETNDIFKEFKVNIVKRD